MPFPGGTIGLRGGGMNIEVVTMVGTVTVLVVLTGVTTMAIGSRIVEPTALAVTAPADATTTSAKAPAFQEDMLEIARIISHLYQKTAINCHLVPNVT